MFKKKTFFFTEFSLEYKLKKKNIKINCVNNLYIRVGW